LASRTRILLEKSGLSQAEAVKITSQKLGNRPATCRVYYIHPAIPEAFVDGRLFEIYDRAPEVGQSGIDLRTEERTALELVSHYTAASAPAKKAARMQPLRVCRWSRDW
jgi:DNA topoisomerase IB